MTDKGLISILLMELCSASLTEKASSFWWRKRPTESQSRNWYDGQRTDFNIADGAMQCESDGESIILVVEKTADRVTIKNQGRTLYNQDFTANDANCRQATSKVKTQVWNYDGSLGLGVFDNSVLTGEISNNGW